MANHRAGNVIFVDTSATFSDVFRIKSVKYIGASSGTLDIKKENTSGEKMHENDGTADVYQEGVNLRSVKGFRVEVSNSATAYLYLE